MKKQWRLLMRLFDIFGKKKKKEEKDDHHTHMQKTGFWGRQGAGVIFLAKDTGRLCISQRSQEVTEPGTWSTWGGAIDDGENPLEAAKREAYEETKLNLNILSMHLVHELVIPKKFKYTTFIAVVESEFEPIVDGNWEVDGFVWCEFGDWPSPLHHGMAKTLKEAKFRNTYKKLTR